MPDLPRTFGKSDHGEWVEVTGRVTRLLPDDGGRTGHQRFVLDLRNRQTVLVAHNVELSDRVPLAMGDRISVRGLYEWNDLGGLVHWTHQDPMDAEFGGYIKFRERIYQ